MGSGSKPGNESDGKPARRRSHAQVFPREPGDADRPTPTSSSDHVAGSEPGTKVREHTLFVRETRYRVP